MNEPGIARVKLAWWRTEVANLFSGQPQHPVTKALAPFAATYGLDAERMNEIIDGMEMDLTHRRYADFAALHLYCHRAAGVVGQLSASVFGYREPSTLEYAESLGIAFQLTNIIRDVGEDARRGRVYLPADELASHGLAPEDILERRGGDAFRRLMAFQAERAESYYEQAFAKLAPVDGAPARRPHWPPSTDASEIKRDGFDVLDRRIALHAASGSGCVEAWVAVTAARNGRAPVAAIGAVTGLGMVRRSCAGLCGHALRGESHRRRLRARASSTATLLDRHRLLPRTHSG